MPAHNATDTAIDGLIAADIARDLFGIDAVAASPLAGYRDENFRIDAATLDRFVLKVAHPDSARDLVEFQASVCAHVARHDPKIPVPVPIPGRDGSTIQTARIGDIDRLVILSPFLSGQHYAEFRPHTAQLRWALGELMGRLDRTLADVVYPSSGRYLEWDLQHAGEAAPLADLIEDHHLRRIVVDIFHEFAESVAPALAGCRPGVIHSDANDYNVLVDCDHNGDPLITGLLDFGDIVDSYVVCELAVAAAYAILGSSEPVWAAADVAAGYHHAYPLQREEVEILFPLIRSRLAMSVVFSARWRARNGGDSAGQYHTITESDAWDALERLADVDPDFATSVFRHACGVEPTARADVLDYLSSCTPAAILSPPPDIDNSVWIDLSASSPEPGGADERLDVARWNSRIAELLKHQPAIYGLGRYDEARICYSSDQFRANDIEPRTVHIGLDLFAPPNTVVFSPLDGRIHSYRDNDLYLDYGPTVIVEHTVPDRDARFFTLYGHLSRDSLTGLKSGTRVSAGQHIGRLGTSDENGGWPSHLHFQIMTETFGADGSFPGVVQPSRREFWKGVCPDPDLIVRMASDQVSRQEESDEITSLRTRFLAPNLSLSYRRPLHIVRGYGQFLYDTDGLDYLDCVNNVAHVGHSHPAVAKAITGQAALLNTNTRYLHKNIVVYARRLAESLPDPLRVCFFVNSGSEANDLALRLATAHTGGTDFVVLSGAYHGNLSSLINISPYKCEGPGGHGLPDNVRAAPAPDVFRGPHASAPDPSHAYAREVGRHLEAILSSGRKVAAFIGESALSCAGQIMLPPDYLKDVYRLVRQHGGICIADEVQVGFGRVGSHFWAFEVQDVVPDIVTMGKPIGNGHPLAAVVTTEQIADSFANGMEYFNTFGGNPVSCAAGLAVLDVLRDERLQQHAADVGDFLVSRLLDLKSRHIIIGDVRGSGLFLGIELVRDRTLTPATEEAAYVVNRMRERRILLSTDGPDENVIKFKPPMVFDRKDGERLVDELDRVLSEDFVSRRRSS